MLVISASTCLISQTILDQTFRLTERSIPRWAAGGQLQSDRCQMPAEVEFPCLKLHPLDAHVRHHDSTADHQTCLHVGPEILGDIRIIYHLLTPVRKRTATGTLADLSLRCVHFMNPYLLVVPPLRGLLDLLRA